MQKYNLCAIAGEYPEGRRLQHEFVCQVVLSSSYSKFPSMSRRTRHDCFTALFFNLAWFGGIKQQSLFRRQCGMKKRAVSNYKAESELRDDMLKGSANKVTISSVYIFYSWDQF